MYAYIVEGSEDGILGVYTSYKKAVEKAKDYLWNVSEENKRIVKHSEHYTSIEYDDGYDYATVKRYEME